MTEEAAQQDLSDYIEAKLKAMHFKSSKVRWFLARSFTPTQ